MFVSPTNLHCSQTYKQTKCHSLPFVSPTNLHCSQTMRSTASVWNSLFPLRIYTALKPVWNIGWQQWRLFPLRIYTALKLLTKASAPVTVCFPYEFTLLSNYPYCQHHHREVCFPYEFTLLSNTDLVAVCLSVVCFPYEFTLLSNLKSSKNNILQNTRVPS